MSADPRIVLNLLASTPGVPADQFLGFGTYHDGDGNRPGRWGDFGWAQGGALLDPVQRRRGRAYGCRLLTFSGTTAATLHREGRSGRLDEGGYVLGFLVDIDSNARRLCWPEGSERWDDAEVWAFYDEVSDDIRDFHPYPPTIERSYACARTIARPTVALDGGGGVPVTYVLTEALAIADVDVEWLGRLAWRFTAAFGNAVTGDGWAFDSPHALTSWLRLPGSERGKYAHFDPALHERMTWALARKHAKGERLDEDMSDLAWRAYRPHVVTVLDADGPRYTLAEIEAIAGPDTATVRRARGYTPDMTTWVDGAPIPQLTGRASAPWWSPRRKKGQPWWTARG